MTEDALLSAHGSTNPQGYSITATWLGQSTPYTAKTEQWFQNLKDIFVDDKSRLTVVDSDKHTPLSEIIAKSILMTRRREFDQPYVKRLRGSNGIEPEWAAWKARRVMEALHTPGVQLSVQYQSTGGKNTCYRLNGIGGAERASAHSFRDDTIALMTTDLFYEDQKAKEYAEKHQIEEDNSTLFSQVDRRFWWGTYESPVKPASWNNYFDSRKVVDRLVAIKKQTDPSDVLTPNRFNVLHLASS